MVLRCCLGCWKDVVQWLLVWLGGVCCHLMGFPLWTEAGEWCPFTVFVVTPTLLISVSTPSAAYYAHRGPFDLLKCCHSHAVSYRLPQVPELPIWCPQIRGVPLASPPTQPNTSGLQPPARSLGQGFVLDVWWFCQWHRSSSAGEMQPPPRVFFKPMSF